MLLTLAKPTKSEFEYKNPHEYSPASSFSSHFSPKFPGSSLRSLPTSASSNTSIMTTPHRGLPPPSAMTLPDPGRGPPPPIPPPPSHSHSLPNSHAHSGQMPAPPSQWQGAEESMRNWLVAKAEEDKRKQEEEKTRQEGLRLEQRKIEQSMLRESMQGGVPPHLVPMIFAGIGGGGLASMTAEWLQQYLAQLQAAQHQQLSQAQSSPDLRRETRLINPAPPTVYSVTAQSVPQGNPSQALPPAQTIPGMQTQHGAFSSSVYASGSISPTTRTRASTVSSQTGIIQPKAPGGASALPRLTTNEMQIHQPPSAPSGVHSLQQSQQSEQQTSSPSIYFHHWVPPTSQTSTGNNPPATPSDYSSSPKKRKAQGSHQAAPPPTSVPQFNSSPQYSQTSSTSSRRGHARTRSDNSTRFHHEGGGQPGSRQEPPSSTHEHHDRSPPQHAESGRRESERSSHSHSHGPGSTPSFSKHAATSSHQSAPTQVSSPKRESGGA